MSNNSKLKEILTQLKKDELQETSSKNTELLEKRKYNIISSKIFTISLILKWLGYLASIIVFIFSVINNQIVIGLLYGLISAFLTFITTTFLDGFAEIIQLLEDIKNK